MDRASTWVWILEKLGGSSGFPHGVKKLQEAKDILEAVEKCANSEVTTGDQRPASGTFHPWT